MVLIKKKNNKHKQLFNSILLPAIALHSASLEGSFDPRPTCFPDFVWKLKGKLVAQIPLLVRCVTDHISLAPPPRFNYL